MPKFFKEHFVHFVLFIFEAAFSYLHKSYDFYYDFECQEFSIKSKEDGVDIEK